MTLESEDLYQPICRAHGNETMTSALRLDLSVFRCTTPEQNKSAGDENNIIAHVAASLAGVVIKFEEFL